MLSFELKHLVTAMLLAISLISLTFFVLAINAYRNNRAGRLIVTDTGILAGKDARNTNPNALTQGIPWSKVKQISFKRDATASDATKGALVVKREWGRRLKLTPQTCRRIIWTSWCLLAHFGRTRGRRTNHLLNFLRLSLRNALNLRIRISQRCGCRSRSGG